MKNIEQSNYSSNIHNIYIYNIPVVSVCCNNSLHSPGTGDLEEYTLTPNR